MQAPAVGTALPPEGVSPPDTAGPTGFSTRPFLYFRNYSQYGDRMTPNARNQPEERDYEGIHSLVSLR